MPTLETRNSIDSRRNALKLDQKTLIDKFNQAAQEQKDTLPFVVVSNTTVGWEEATSDFKKGKFGKGMVSVVVFRQPIIAKVSGIEKEMLIGITNNGDTLVFLSWNPFESNGNGANEQKSGNLEIQTMKKDRPTGEFSLSFHNVTHTGDALARFYGAKDEVADELLKNSLLFPRRLV